MWRILADVGHIIIPKAINWYLIKVRRDKQFFPGHGLNLLIIIYLPVVCKARIDFSFRFPIHLLILFIIGDFMSLLLVRLGEFRVERGPLLRMFCNAY